LFAVTSVTSFNLCYWYKTLLFSNTVLVHLRLIAQCLKLQL